MSRSSDFVGGGQGLDMVCYSITQSTYPNIVDLENIQRTFVE